MREWREDLHKRDREGQFSEKPGAKLAERLTKEWSAATLKDVQARNPDVSLDVSQSKEGVVTLSLIRVGEESRGGGKAEKALRDLTAYADAHGLLLAATPSSDFGASKAKLTAWYKRHGFVPNKGRAKDFRTRETMVREPKS